MNPLLTFKRLIYRTLLLHRSESATVRYAFPLLFVAVAFFGASALVGGGASSLRLATDAMRVTEGSQFTVDVYARAHVPVNAVDVEVTFPSSMVEVTGIDTGESVITLWTKEPYSSGGTVYLSGGTFRKGFVGEHLLAQINLKAKQTGEVTFLTNTASFHAGDGSGSAVPIESDDEDTLTVDVAAEVYADVFEAAALVLLNTDIDGDGAVDMTDVMSFMDAWLKKKATFDFNSDGTMNFTDFAIILADAFYK